MLLTGSTSFKLKNRTTSLLENEKTYKLAVPKAESLNFQESFLSWGSKGVFNFENSQSEIRHLFNESFCFLVVLDFSKKKNLQI